MWKPNLDNVFLRGLIMSFEADHGITPNGRITTGLWSSLLSAVATNSMNSGGYNYALMNKSAPELLTIWHDGKVVLKSQANTGIAGSPTPDGTFTVYPGYADKSCVERTLIGRSTQTSSSTLPTFTATMRSTIWIGLITAFLRALAASSFRSAMRRMRGRFSPMARWSPSFINRER